MPTPKGPVEPPLEIELEDEDDERTQAAPLDFVPGEKSPPSHAGISLDDDDDERTTIEKRPGPSR
jgi:hypothetical protein